ncbi:MAG: protein translocase subunit SecF [Candidatus Krumholzibacteriota bacterium]|nr:protein translocase subunit SecF [Candidatus Krumholzibacteriota bacterium]
MQFFGETHINFVDFRNKAFILSLVLILAGLGSLAIKGGPDLSIDFEGGTLVQLRFDKPVPISTLRTIIEEAGYEKGDIQEFGDPKEFLITIEKISETEIAAEKLLEALVKTAPDAGWNLVSAKEMPPDFSRDFEGGNLVVVEAASLPPMDGLKEGVRENGVGFVEVTKESESRVAFSLPYLGIESKAAQELKEIVMAQFPDRKIEIRRTETVGPKIGEELKNRAWAAIIISMFGILVYISWRFEFKFAIGAILALAHDVIITLGIFSLLGKEISLVIIAALLTIVGYSLNDTIVVFDRIRENFSLRRRESYDRMINISINESLGRTIITSLTTLIVVVSLYFYGGEVIHDFAFALLVGVVVGTYSSIFVASPVLIEWQNRFTARSKTRS